MFRKYYSLRETGLLKKMHYMKTISKLEYMPFRSFIKVLRWKNYVKGVQLWIMNSEYCSIGWMTFPSVLEYKCKQK